MLVQCDNRSRSPSTPTDTWASTSFTASKSLRTLTRSPVSRCDLDHGLREVVVHVRVDAEQELLHDQQVPVAGDVPRRLPTPRARDLPSSRRACTRRKLGREDVPFDHRPRTCDRRSSWRSGWSRASTWRGSSRPRRCTTARSCATLQQSLGSSSQLPRRAGADQHGCSRAHWRRQPRATREQMANWERRGAAKEPAQVNS